MDLILFAAYTDILGPSTVITSGNPPDITDTLTLSEYTPPLSLRGTNSISKKYFPLNFSLNSFTDFEYAYPSVVSSITWTHIDTYSSPSSNPNMFLLTSLVLASEKPVKFTVIANKIKLHIFSLSQLLCFI